MKVKSLIILIAVAIGIIAFCSRTKTTPTKNHLKVGAAIALTGFGSDFGQSENNAIKLLKEKYGPAGEVEFYIEDTRSDVRSGVTAIKKLIDINKCDIVYCELSSIVNAASSIIRKAEVTLIAPVYLDLEDNPFAVRNLPSADQENTALIDFLISNNVVHDKIAVFLYTNAQRIS